jgi:uncharacterized protein
VVRYLGRRSSEAQHLHINWFGGEPLLGLRQLGRIVSGLRQPLRDNGCTLSQFMTTNGYLLTPGVAAGLADLGVSSVQVTLDGDAPRHDTLRPSRRGNPTYARVLQGCVNAVDAGMSLLLRVNLNRFNAGGVAAMLADVLANGLTPDNTVVHLTRMVDHGEQTCDELTASTAFGLPEFAHAWVEALVTVTDRGFAIPHLDPIAFNCPFDLPGTVMIKCDGSLSHCSSSDAPLCDLSDEGVETRRTALYAGVKNRSPLDDPECRECRFLPLCMGGCSYLRELGQEHCAPERYVLPELVALTARATERR